MLVECTTCDATVDGKVIATYEFVTEWGDGPYRCSLLSCPRCELPALVMQALYQVSDDTYEYELPYRVYPSQGKQANPSLPAAIRDAYQEALVCRRSQAYTAAAIMCRKALEGMCNEHGYSKGNLETRLSRMKAAGVIESRLFEWADALRILGNEAAHGVDVKFSKQDADDLIEFTDAILEYAFTFRDKFDRFMERRDKAKTKHS